MTFQSSVNKTVLPNGVRVLSERVPYVDSVSVGIWAQVGARDEDSARHGLSHFIEHMVFKGTRNRTSRQIADEMDSLGGQLNAFTDKEFTCYYSKVLCEHLPRALDVLSDMVLGPVFDSEEIEREKNVVLEEIKRHQDTPEDQVHDMLVESLWRNHRLGNSVIGSAGVVRKLKRDHLVGYMEEFYRPDALVISAAGKVDHQQLVDAVAAAFGGLTGSRPKRINGDVEAQFGSVIVNKSTEQVHFCLGTQGFAQSSRQKYVLAAIDSAIGGGMSSRLFQEIRENRGLAYAIGSYSSAYQEAGMFAVYGGTSVSNISSVLDLVQKELHSLAESGVTDEELERAKNQIRSALVLGQESMSNRMSRLARNELYFGRIVRLDEIIDSITGVEREDVARVASEIFSDGRFALAAIGPFKKYRGALDSRLAATA